MYRKLRNFRAGIEAAISCLKRAYGLARRTCCGLDTSGTRQSTPVWTAAKPRDSFCVRGVVRQL